MANALTNDPDLGLYAMRMLEALSQKQGMDSIMEIGHELLGNPFHVVDLSWKLIGSTKSAGANEDLVWREFEETGYLSLSSVTHYLDVKFTPKLINSPEPFIWYDGYTKYGRLMGRISIGDKAIGVVGALDVNKPFEERDIGRMALLCDTLSSEMQKNKYTRYIRGLLHEAFLRDLLDRKITDYKIIQERTQYLDITPKENNYILSVDIDEFDKTHISLSFLQGLFERLISGSKGIVYDEKIVMIISSSEKKDFEVRYREKIQKAVRNQKLHFGISRSFRELAAAHHYYIQSKEAIEIGRHFHDPRLFIPYDDYAIYHIVEACSRQDDINRFCHPGLQTLVDYDRQYKTPYTRSLQAYLQYQRSITKAADAMNIHRNTMVYRIEKIGEIMNSDLSDYETQLYIELSFKFMMYHERNLDVLDNPDEYSPAFDEKPMGI